MKPLQLPLCATRGDTFRDKFDLEDENDVTLLLSTLGATAKFTIKDKLDGTTIHQATSPAEITLADTDPNVTMNIPAATTAAWTYAKAVYDLEITIGAQVTTWLLDEIELQKDVS